MREGWVTKYVLTKGIYKDDVESKTLEVGKDIHETYADALRRSLVIVSRKRESLKKALKKLNVIECLLKNDLDRETETP